MWRYCGLAFATITASYLVGLEGVAHGQVPAARQAVPPAGGYPHRTIREVPPAEPGPSSGMAVPGLPTVPGTMPSLPTGIGAIAAPNMPAAAPTHVGGFDPRFQFWSPTTAVWDIGQQLNLAKPITIYGSRAATGATTSTTVPSTAVGDLPALQGMEAGGGILPPTLPAPALPAPALPAPEMPELQAAEPNVEGADAPLPAPILPAAPGALAAGLPFGPPKPALDIPFEEFETFEEFNEWLRQKVAAPGDGMLGPGPPADTTLPPSGPGTSRSQSSSRSQRPEYHPPIGYIGVGSSARVQLGNVNLGPNVAADSARLVSELNDFLRSSRGARRAQPWESGAGARQSLPPPPTSDLGRRRPSTTFPPATYPSASAAGQFTPQVQPRQYWQNLGGYEPPTLRLEDWQP